MPDRLTLGVEEEFFILPKSRIVSDETYRAVDEIIAALKAKFPACPGQRLVRAEQELFKLQVELKTPPCRSVAQVRAEMHEYRQALRDVLADYDFLAYASGTHPTQDWRGVERKKKKLRTLAFRTAIADEMAVCGMHVHVGVPDRETRFALFNFLRGFLPLFLALSTSSAFWRGQHTGLISYRPSIFGTVPRGAIPPFLTQEQFDDYLNALGRIEDEGELIQAHWFLRPSAFWPTIEVRMMDMCPAPDDAVAIVALIACLSVSFLSDGRRWQGQAGHLHNAANGLPERLRLFVNPPQHLLAESIWRVQKHGLKARILGESGGKIVDFQFSEVLPLIGGELSQIAGRLGCGKELQHLHEIARKGTSSERQISCYERELAASSEAQAVLAASQSILLDFGYDPAALA